jgi:phosphoribosylpyrophosphate synthetase
MKPIAKDVANSKAQEKIVGRLAFACWGRMQQAFDSWKYAVFANLKAEVERKKAKIIDDLIRNAMGPLQKAFILWAGCMRAA